MTKLRVSNPDLAEIVEHMTRLEPENRFSVDEYLHKWPKEVFPAFFGPLHDLLSPLMTWAQDHSVLLLKASFSGFLTRLQNKHEPQNSSDGAATQVGEPPFESSANDDSSPHQQLKQLPVQTSTQVLNAQHAAEGETNVDSGSASGSGNPPAAQSFAQAQSGNEQQGVHLHLPHT